MAREKQDFRIILEQLNGLFPGREVLTLQEVMALTGYRSPSSVRAHFSIVRGRINKVTLAREMCQ